ncbi:helix-turn-helix transcriptional regulator [Paenibacillus sp. XY044]|uniref:helix-turn-helix domain-containing protein n=1 Tax=Paenibacillus sp. XY044 TaxID=2026089 RepID=UPI000B98CE91|nr:helix-turn-helix transcriptional regulator [Paenibacillus sp. XY044]OZB95223.1 XRE family transcriptional regulator [Paenibacillus sp. XY044]
MLIWMLRQVMAERGIWTGAALARVLKDKAGYELSPPSISALLNGNPKQMKADTMDALCTALDCTPSDLWHHTPSTVKGA